MAEMFAIDSSNITSVGFGFLPDHPGDTGVLTVIFKNKKTYSYRGVPNSIFQDFMNSESKGKFLAQNIKGIYDVQEVVENG